MTVSWKCPLGSQPPSLESWLAEMLLVHTVDPRSLVLGLEPHTCLLDIPSKKVKYTSCRHWNCVMLNHLKMQNFTVMDCWCVHSELLPLVLGQQGWTQTRNNHGWLQGRIIMLILTNLATWGIEEPWDHVILRVFTEDLKKNNKFLLEIFVLLKISAFM